MSGPPIGCADVLERWYHHVAQRGDEEGLCISMNWWYESEFAFGDRWALEEFVKEIGQLSREECIDH